MESPDSILAIGLTLRLIKIVPDIVLHYFLTGGNHYLLIISNHTISDIPDTEITDIVSVMAFSYPQSFYMITDKAELIPADLQPRYIFEKGRVKKYRV